MQKQPLHNTVVSPKAQSRRPLIPISVRPALSFRIDFMPLGYSQIREDLEAAMQPWDVGVSHGFGAMDGEQRIFLATKKVNS
jgi:hypothetical protein